MGVFSKSESDDKGLNVSRGDAKPDAKAASGQTSPETISTLGHGVLVTGNIVTESTLQVFGRINGDIHASHLVIKEGAAPSSAQAAMPAKIALAPPIREAAPAIAVADKKSA